MAKKIIVQGAMHGMARGMATNSWNVVANMQHEKNKRQPIKVYTKEEIAELVRKRATLK
jgi:ABC-type lipoprotein release transport system permease subunit